MEIKQSYRRLARLYHPDRNKAEHAETLFKEINAAYEVLGDPVKKWEYDNRLVVAVHRQVSRDPAMRRRQAGYRPRRSGPSEVFLAKQAALPFLRWVFITGVLFCFFLLLDFALPPLRVRDQILANQFELMQIRGGVNRNTLITESGKHLQMGGNERAFFPPSSVVEIHRSRLFAILVTVRNPQTNYQAGNLATVYRNFSFAPIVLFFVSVLGLVYRKHVDFTFNLGVAGVFTIFLTMLFTYLSIV